MKRKIYFALFLSFLIIISISFWLNKNVFSNIKENLSKQYYYDTLKIFNTYIDQQKTLLISISKYLANSPSTKKAYLYNNKKFIIEEFLPFYNYLHQNNIIDEIHFFKNPIINFVSFSNLKLKETNLKANRKDILKIINTLQPSTYFFICSTYPGLRSTYPIIFNSKIYGSVSVGVSLLNIKKFFDKLNMKSTIYLNNSLLKNSLNEESYNYYKKYPLYEGYRVIGPLYKGINLHKKYIIHDTYLYIIIPIIDTFNNKTAYLIIKRDFKKIFEIVKQNAIKKLIIKFLIYFFVFILFLMLFRYIYRRFNELEKILQLIKEKKFEQLPIKVKEKDEFDKFKNNLINVAKNLSLYINLLNNEKDFYSKKAFIDELTSTYNRNFLETKANEITEKYKIIKEPLGIIIFDIDNFKKINDTYGHDIGDLVLSEVAKNIKKFLRKDDLFIRYGGEEFLILLPNTTFKEAITLAEKIRKIVENLSIKIPNDILKFTISMGVSELSMNDNNIYDAIKRADEKLYKAKKSGKNKIFY